MTFPRRGEIYLVAFDPTLGHEIRKTRPAVVIQNDISNQYSPINAQVVRTNHLIVFVDNENVGHLAIPVEIVHAEANGDRHDDILVDAATSQILGAHRSH